MASVPVSGEDKITLQHLQNGNVRSSEDMPMMASPNPHYSPINESVSYLPKPNPFPSKLKADLPIVSAPAAAIGRVTQPTKPQGFTMLIVRSDSRGDAYKDSHSIREENLPRFLGITEWSQPEEFFSQDFITKNGLEYTKWLILHIANWNQYYIRGFAEHWKFLCSQVMQMSSDDMHALFYRRVVDAFTLTDIEQYGVPFLDCVLKWCQMCSGQLKGPQAGKDAFQKAQQKVQLRVSKHRKSLSHGTHPRKLIQRLQLE